MSNVLSKTKNILFSFKIRFIFPFWYKRSLRRSHFWCTMYAVCHVTQHNTCLLDTYLISLLEQRFCNKKIIFSLKHCRGECDRFGTNFITVVSFSPIVGDSVGRRTTPTLPTKHDKYFWTLNVYGRFIALLTMEMHKIFAFRQFLFRYFRWNTGTAIFDIEKSINIKKKKLPSDQIFQTYKVMERHNIIFFFKAFGLWK